MSVTNIELYVNGGNHNATNVPTEHRFADRASPASQYLLGSSQL